MEDDLPTQYDVIVVGTGIVITIMKTGATGIFVVVVDHWCVVAQMHRSGVAYVYKCE
jgi:hypothetical protein